jgi:hypothetical protein
LLTPTFSLLLVVAAVPGPALRAVVVVLAVIVLLFLVKTLVVGLHARPVYY